MPFREKTAWLSLIAIAITFGPYFAMVATSPPSGPLPNLRQLEVYAVASIAQALVILGGRLFLSAQSPADARMPLDERDQLINGRAKTWAYYVLMAGVILVGVVMPFTSGGWTIVNAAVAVITAAQVVNYGGLVVSYRRQS